MHRTILLNKKEFSETINAVKAVLDGLPEVGTPLWKLYVSQHMFEKISETNEKMIKVLEWSTGDTDQWITRWIYGMTDNHELDDFADYHYEKKPRTPEDLYDFLIWTYAPDGPDTEDYFNDDEEKLF